MNESSWYWPPELWQKAVILLLRLHYLRGHLKADIGADLEIFTHLF